MKILSILAVASLALAPAIASAGSSGDSTDNGRPISGPLAGRVIDRSAIPVAPLFVGAGVAGVALLLVLLSDDDGTSSTDSTIDTTPGTNNGKN